MTHNQKSPLYKEQVTHGTQDFPMGFYEVSSKDSWTGINHHWHEEIEILFFAEGSGIMEINMEAFPVKNNSFFFVNSGGLHSMTANGSCQESAVLFHPRMLCFDTYDIAQSSLIQPLLAGSLLLPRAVSSDHSAFLPLKREYDELVNICQTCQNSISTDVSAQMFLKAGLLKILGILFAHNLLESSVIGNYKEQAIKAVLSYIRTHYQDTIRIQELADLVNLNEQYFCRFFKSAIGQSPVPYINQYRIRQSMLMLKNTDQTVTDIGLHCGFLSFGNFSKEFKRQTGLTPLKYRQSLQKHPLL